MKLGESSRVGYTLFALSALLFLAPSAFAEGPAPLVEQLPPPTAELSESNLRISDYNLSRFREILPKELLPLIQNGNLILRVAMRPNFGLQMDEAWRNTSRRPQAGIEIDSVGGLSMERLPERGLFFGSFDDHNAVAGDQRILWNFSAWSFPLRVLALDAKVFFLKNDLLQREVDLNYLRMYPKLVLPEDKTGQLYREKLTVNSPQAVAGFSWLDIRFFNNSRDYFWGYSPAIRQLVPLSSANLSDPLPVIGLPFEDWFLWNGNPSEFKVVLGETQQILVPVSPAPLQSLERRGDCTHLPLNISKRLSSQQWNFQAAQFASAAGWVPLNILFIPREVRTVEIWPEDPNANYGWAVIYFDQELMIPYYKIVYSRSGVVQRILFAPYAMWRSASEDRKELFPYQLVSYSPIDNQAVLVEYRNIKFCQQLPDNLTLRDLEFR